MRFELNDNALRVIAETQADVLTIVRHYDLLHSKRSPEQLIATAQAISAGSIEYVDKGTDKRPWFDVPVCLDKALEPYQYLLKRLTGYDGPILDMDLTLHDPKRLVHTHITGRIGIEDGCITALVFVRSEDWNGQTAELRSADMAADYLQERLGFRRFEREHIQMDNGLYRHNPDYLKHHKAQPGLGAEWLWKVLFSWWRENHATNRQRAVLNAVDALHNGSKYPNDYDLRCGSGETGWVSGYTLFALDPNGPCNYDGKGKMARCYTWDEFRSMV